MAGSNPAMGWIAAGTLTRRYRAASLRAGRPESLAAGVERGAAPLKLRFPAFEEAHAMVKPQHGAPADRSACRSLTMEIYDQLRDWIERPPTPRGMAARGPQTGADSSLAEMRRFHEKVIARI